MLKLYDTFVGAKREFVPIDPNCVTAYLCGPTVYSYSHVGNFRPPVIFDVLVRLLRREYPKVLYSLNITDIDDKINAAAKEQSVDISVISEKYTEIYNSDLTALGVRIPDIQPKVTDHIGEIHDFISQLLQSGNAYFEQGHVLFDVESYSAYGRLGRRNMDEMLAGARIDVASYKKNEGDFVLWKPSSDDQPGWDSPWGRGRPGWHIECSAMSAKHLGKTIDIHGGGLDLVFPHHENERAQSNCVNGGKEFVNYWLHNGLINFGDEKMSKSLGNVLLVHDLLDEVPGEVIRYVLISAHYRAPLDWNDKAIATARKNVDKLYSVLRRLDQVPLLSENHIPDAFLRALRDDLNTSLALTELYVLVRQANKETDHKRLSQIKTAIVQASKMLGLGQQNWRDWFGVNSSASEASEIELLIAKRQTAKEAKDWTKADKLRAQLLEMGVVLEDGAEGTRWRMQVGFEIK